MRTKNSIYNVLSNLFIVLFQTIMLFVVRTFFIKILGEENLGLSGLFTNILNILSVTELGIGTIISFSLYKPLSEKDTKKINALMNFYKKFYYLAGIIIIVLGILIIPFLPFFVKDYSANNVYVIYLLYLINTAFIYFVAYKEILILSDQKNYKLTNINFFFMLAMYLLQIFVLVKFKSFVLYLLVQFIITLLQKIFINIYITKSYPEVDFKSKNKLDKKTLKEIKDNLKCLFFNKVGELLIFCTDNILISSLVNLVSVGIYSNYSSIITITRTLINSIYTAVTASFGDFALKADGESKKVIFEIMDFVRFLLYGICTIGFFLLINYFITLWIGKDYVFNAVITFIICLNFYLMGTQVSLDVIKQAIGFFKKDRFITLMQAVFNLVLSIILGLKYGIIGILIATSISYIILPCWNKPYLIYKYIFNSSVKKYYVRELLNIIVLVIIGVISYYAIGMINIPISIIGFIVDIIIVTLIFAIIISIFYFKTKEYKFLLNFVIERVKGIMNRKGAPANE